MGGKKIPVKWVILLVTLVGILNVCVDLEEKNLPTSSYASVSVVEQASLGAEEKGQEAEKEAESSLSIEDIEEQEDLERRKKNFYFAAFVTLGAVGNSISLYKLAKRMK